MLDGIDEAVLPTELFHGFEGGGEITPLNTILTAESGLMDFGMGRCGGDATQIDGLHTESVGGAENTADVVHGPHIVEDDDKGQLGGSTELFHRETVHFYRAEFAHGKWG